MSSQAWCSKGREPGFAFGPVGQAESGWLKGRGVRARLMLFGTIVASVASLLSSCTSPPADPPHAETGCRVIRADVVAIEQAYVLNRFAAFVPAGMMYALRHDVVAADRTHEVGPGNAMLRPDKRPRPLVLRVNEGDCLEVTFENLLDPQREEEGGLPPDLAGKLPAHVEAPPGTPTSRELVVARKASLDRPRTRTASLHLTGLELVPMRAQDCPVNAACGGDGSNVGLPSRQGVVFNAATPQTVRDDFLGSLAKPGQKVVTRWRAVKEGTYFAYSTAAPVGGEGDGGQIGLGLFAAVNVEPKGATWYRSQVTHTDLQQVTRSVPAGRHAYRDIAYDARRALPGGGSRPVLAMLDGDRIVHSDVNAIIVVPEGAGQGKDSPACKDKGMYGGRCGASFREFTVILHDEIHAQQAFAELEDPNNPLHYLKDGMGINYGASSMGSAVMSTPLQRNVGVAKNCPECRAEEFFLSSWANGDPALVLQWGADGKQPVGARYKDDPSNVHHSYLGDAVRFRNLHAGPKETHVFHLHAHQWVMDASDPDSTYLDSQTISPGATFSYGIEFGGSGNRNFTPGDSIFHCHLYPHFAQGMWELWRTHDVFEDGNDRGLYRPDQAAGPANDPRWRRLPDAEVAGGTENPALVPIPGEPLAPLPTAAFAGYPFYVPGQAGHRPPQPPLDMDVTAAGYDPAAGVEPAAADLVNGGLPRHIVTGGTLRTARADPAVREHALATGGEAAQLIAQRVARQDPVSLQAFAAVWDQIEIKPLPHSGTVGEKNAMTFHEGKAPPGSGLIERKLASADDSSWWPETKGFATDYAATVASQTERTDGEAVFRVNGRPPAAGAPYANPCPANAPSRDYRAAYIQTELTYNKHGWFDPQARMAVLENDVKDIIDPATRTRLPEPLFFRANSGDCITYKSSNFVPSALNADDFQVFTPTDTIGQHIHLVKFDVTSSDGSGNGWNYEDGTFSPDEVRERIFANNRRVAATGAGTRLAPATHPLFRAGGDIFKAATQTAHDPQHRNADLEARGQCPPQASGETDAQYERHLREHHPLCGAQRTTQRWWADPIINARGKDNTLRTVFSHDHFGPSSHQQHGLYAALVIEPANSVWTRVDAQVAAPDLQQAGAQMAASGNLGCDDGSAFRSPLCGRLLGGANLARPVPANRKAGADPVLGVIEPRDALVLRTDGGPTSTLANIFAPHCIAASDSNPLQPDEGRAPNASTSRAECRPTEQTRREFALAIADFGIAYNTALEPINPEPRGEDGGFRDHSAVRFGQRHVAALPARPLGITGEDPGSQYINYRHEPLALRIAEATAVDPADSASDPLAALGGFSYRQSSRRAFSALPCNRAQGDQDCLGDMANAFSTEVHAARDERLARQPQVAHASSSTRDLLRAAGLEPRLDRVLAQVEQWRQDFNCALYRQELLGDKTMAGDKRGPCDPRIRRLEPWREFGDPATPILPAFEGDPVEVRLIQGAQEAQHIFTMNGARWHRLPASTGSGYTNAQPIGISEHFEFDLQVNPLGLPVSDHLFFASSVDQLWDGMWGVLRSYKPPRAGEPAAVVYTSGAGSDGQNDTARGKPVTLASAGLAPVIPTPAIPVGDLRDQMCKLPDGTQAPRRFFEVSAVRACQIAGDCDQPQSRGIVYSQRYDIRDPQAIVYALHQSQRCEANAAAGGALPRCDALDAAARTRPLDAALAELRQRHGAGAPIEPLVLRAAAGECLQVALRNLLPPVLPDGPAAALPGQALSESQSSHDSLPMITDGFNVNQFAMSSSVGFSVPRLTQNLLFGDGSNVGINGAVALAPGLSRGEDMRVRQVRAAPMQGSLIPPCLPGASGTALNRCQQSFLLSTLEPGPGREPVEYGALPVRSFGDVVKQPMHGLMGAVVIGPPGAEVCEDNRFAKTRVSAEVCVPAHAGRAAHRYVDHVLLFQDAVMAWHGDMPVRQLSGAEEPDDRGMKAWNYRTEPLWARRGNDPSVGFDERNQSDFSEVFSSRVLAGPGGQVRCAAGIPPVLARANPCDPETPIFLARAGERVRLHFVHAGGHTRQQGVALSGHPYNPYPWSPDSRQLDASAGSSIRQGVFNGFGPMMGVSLEFTAGGSGQVPLDYLMTSQASFLRDGGMWGLLRVEPAAARH